MKRNKLSYQQLVARYKRYRRKLQRIENGSSNYKRKNLIIKRLKQLHAQIMAMRASWKLATASAALGATMLMTAPTLKGQNLVFQTDNILGTANIEGSAKPRVVDFDGDGDLDLFIGGKLRTTEDPKSANVLYYQNINGKLFAAPSPFPDTLNIDPILFAPSEKDTARVSPAFIDYDGDNDLDAFIGLSDSTVIYYRNDGGSMVGVTGMDNPFDGVKMPSHNVVPYFADLDGDGDMDAVIGKEDGYLAYFENDAGAFVKKDGADNPFDGLNVGNNSAPAFADLDGDGDMDLFVGNKDGTITYIENDSGTFAPGATNPFGFIAADTYGNSLAPDFGDIDGDGDIDAFMGTNDGLINYFRNDADTAFTWVPYNPLGIEYVGNSMSNAFVDIDGDSDMDLFTGDGDGFVHHHVYDSGTFMLQDSANNPLNSSIVKVDYIANPAFADIDTDGDMDAFVGSYMNHIVYLANDGGVFAQDTANNPFKGIDPGNNENIAFVDWDNDGDMDAFIGNKNGDLRYYENNAGVFTEITGAANPFDGISFQTPDLPNWTTAIAFADIDGDGDDDAYVGTNNGFIRYFTNDGGTLTEQTGANNPFDGVDFGRAASPDFADIDGDGDMDLVVGNANGQAFYFENVATVGIKDEPGLSAQTRVYPNPTNGLLRIEMKWNQGPALIRVSNLAGQMVLQQAVSGHESDLNLQPLPAGVYLMSIQSEQGQVIKKVIKR